MPRFTRNAAAGGASLMDGIPDGNYERQLRLAAQRQYMSESLWSRLMCGSETPGHRSVRGYWPTAETRPRFRLYDLYEPNYD